MGNPYSTTMASYDMPLLQRKNKKTYLGVGGFIYSDKASDSHFGTTSGNLSLAAIVPADEQNTLSAGFQAGFLQRSADISNRRKRKIIRQIGFECADAL